ncbi:MAG: LytR C-terminal domain-containing protein, partial [Cloacibacillus porcorum]|uniref:LytR C-terminal domain-containing protein n=1 Tax=Cloacibacillus porcorum TaxID=1197717 RepID=UPI0023F27EEE
DRLSYWMGDVKAANAFLNAPVEALISGDVTEGSCRNAKQVHFTSAGDAVTASADVSGEGSQPGTQTVQSGAKKDEMSKDELMTLIKSMPESVAVLNGTGKAGVSAEISTCLQQLGVDVIHSGNAKHFDYQHCNIVYPTNASEKVKTTARQLGTLLKIPKNLVRPSQQAFFASIIAGHDYKKLTTLLDNMLKISNQ